MLHRENIQSESLNMLKLIAQRGNVTTYEWRVGSAPSRIEQNRTTADTTDEQEQGNVDEDVSALYLGTKIESDFN